MTPLTGDGPGPTLAGVGRAGPPVRGAIALKQVGLDLAVPPAQGVVVLGMHRSGTSLAAGLLELGGLRMCLQADLVEACWSNPTGHRESRRLLAANDQLLAELGSAWDRPPACDVSERLRALVPVLGESLRAEFLASYPASGWIWKDPRTAITLPFWREVLPEFAVVLMLRNPLEVAGSLERRNGLDTKRSLELWESYLSHAIAALSGLPVMVSWYPSVLTVPRAWVNRVRDFLAGHGLLPGPADWEAIEGLASRALHHHRHDDIAVFAADAVTASQAGLYHLLLQLPEQVDDWPVRNVGARQVTSRPSSATASASASATAMATASATAEVADAPRVTPPGPEPVRTVWVAGFPSRYGGADTELDHTIDLWRSAGFAVHLVPMFGATDEMVRSVIARGCEVHAYRPGIFRDRTVVSYCNGEFLRLLPEIVETGRPGRVVWFNCMTWPFENELRAHEAGWIDVFGFVSNYQESQLRPHLERIAPYKTFPYRPYFNARRVPWQPREFAGIYGLGRISRDDSAKFAPDTWQIFDRVLVPANLRKKVFILGHGPNAAARIGLPPVGLDWLTWSPDAIPSADFYRRINTMIHKTGGSSESYCRVVVEAYAHGVVPIVEDAYALPELVVHGETGFRSSDSDEMSYLASVLAFDERRHRAIAEAGRRHLEELVNQDAALRGWLEVL